MTVHASAVVDECRRCLGPRPKWKTYCESCRSVCLSERRARRRKVERAQGIRASENHRQRARRYGAEYEPVIARRVFERDAWICGICREPVDADLAWPHPRSASLDHTVPLARGGAHSYENTRCAHLTCNSSAGALVRRT